jgi:DNA-binding XRE family transcriptional regulator
MIEGTSAMDTITLTTQEYQDIIDARDHAISMRDVATGAMETLTEAEVTAYLAASSPLAFWRHHRGLSQTSLAAAAGISQPYLAQIEAGKRIGDVNLYAKFAKTLNVRIEDLVSATEN